MTPGKTATPTPTPTLARTATPTATPPAGGGGSAMLYSFVTPGPDSAASGIEEFPIVVTTGNFSTTPSATVGSGVLGNAFGALTLGPGGTSAYLVDGSSGNTFEYSVASNGSLTSLGQAMTEFPEYSMMESFIDVELIPCPNSGCSTLYAEVFTATGTTLTEYPISGGTLNVSGATNFPLDGNFQILVTNSVAVIGGGSITTYAVNSNGTIGSSTGSVATGNGVVELEAQWED
jgi:hypothetical protein